MTEKKCCVPNCSSVTETLHKFPNPAKDPDRFRTWVFNIGGEVLHLENDYIFKRRRVCHLHFEPQYHTRSKYLSIDAIPRLYLPDHGIHPNETQEVEDNMADFILFMDNLFDSNGSFDNSNVRSGKESLQNIRPNSKHKEMWLQAKTVLKTMK